MLYDPKWEVPAETKIEPWRKTLLDAADRLDRKGWCQHRLWDDDGRACALGAIALVSPGCWEADSRLRKYLGVPNIADWNNEFGRTKDEVTAAMRGAAHSS